MGARSTWITVLGRFGPLMALVVLCVGVSILSPDFRKLENPFNIIKQWSFVGIVAVGMTFVIIVGGIDLSVGSMVALLGGGGILVMNALKEAGSPEWVCLAAGIGTMIVGGGVLGLFNGAMVSWGRIAPFIATLGTMAIYRSVILAAADGSEIRCGVEGFREIGTGGIEVPVLTSSRGDAITVVYPVVAFLVVAVLAQLALKKTGWGLNVHAIGDNATAARYGGVRTGRVTASVYALCGVLCGVAALMNSSRLNSVSSSSAGQLYELDAIAACVIGGTRMRGGSGSIVGTVIGVLILGVVGNMLNMLDVSPHLQGLVKGCIIVAAVLVQRGQKE